MYLQTTEAHNGRRPVTTSVVLVEQGNMVESVNDPCARWARHFQGILNI